MGDIAWNPGEGFLLTFFGLKKIYLFLLILLSTGVRGE